MRGASGSSKFDRRRRRMVVIAVLAVGIAFSALIALALFFMNSSLGGSS
jgi:hypothetical protein